VREDKGISQEKLAELMGGHRNTIGKIERGELNFTFDYSIKIARALKRTVGATRQKALALGVSLNSRA